MNKIFQIIMWLVIFTGIIFLLSFAVTDHKQATCTSVNISFTDQAQKSFIDEEGIKNLITTDFDTLTGGLLDSINTSAIASTLTANPYIRKAAVFESVSGNIEIEVERELPLVRIINKNHENFYLAQSGTVLPVSKSFTPHVLIASGDLDDNFKSVKESTFSYNSEIEAAQHTMSSAHYIAAAIENHPYLNSHIEQIYFNKSGNIELVPADGDHIIVLGDVVDLSKKISNLMAFYQAGKPAVRDGYQVVNLKYTNQVVCKK